MVNSEVTFLLTTPWSLLKFPIELREEGRELLYMFSFYLLLLIVLPAVIANLENEKTRAMPKCCKNATKSPNVYLFSEPRYSKQYRGHAWKCQRFCSGE